MALTSGDAPGLVANDQGPRGCPQPRSRL